MEALRNAFGNEIWAGLKIPDGVLEVGDVGVFRFVKEPAHLGFIGDDRHYPFSLIHAYSMVGKVVEHGLDANWQDKIVAVFRRSI